MPVVGCRNNHNLDLLHVEDLAEVLESLRPFSTRRLVFQFLSDHLLGFVHLLRVHVAEGQYVNLLGIQEVAEFVATHAAAPDQSDAEPVIGTGRPGGRKHRSGPKHAQAGGHTGHRLAAVTQKLSSRQGIAHCVHSPFLFRSLAAGCPSSRPRASTRTEALQVTPKRPSGQEIQAPRPRRGVADSSSGVVGTRSNRPIRGLAITLPPSTTVAHC